MSPLRLLITRPQEDAERLAEALLAKGHAVLIEPLLEVVPDAGRAPLETDGMQAVLLTSRNGARALGSATARRDLAILAVGDATAEAARLAGFSRVASAGGDVATLADLAQRTLDPAQGPLLHVSGKAAAGDLAAALADAGFTVRRRVLYEARPVKALSAAAAAALGAGSLDGVLFFSPRTAAAFVRLARAAALAPTAARLTAFCLSRAVAEAAAELPWRQVAVATCPDQGSLLHLIEKRGGAG